MKEPLIFSKTERKREKDREMGAGVVIKKKLKQKLPKSC